MLDDVPAGCRERLPARRIPPIPSRLAVPSGTVDLVTWEEGLHRPGSSACLDGHGAVVHAHAHAPLPIIGPSWRRSPVVGGGRPGRRARRGSVWSRTPSALGRSSTSPRQAAAAVSSRRIHRHARSRPAACRCRRSPSSSGWSRAYAMPMPCPGGPVDGDGARRGTCRAEAARRILHSRSLAACVVGLPAVAEAAGDRAERHGGRRAAVAEWHASRLNQPSALTSKTRSNSAGSLSGSRRLFSRPLGVQAAHRCGPLRAAARRRWRAATAAASRKVEPMIARGAAGALERPGWPTSAACWALQPGQLALPPSRRARSPRSP